MTRPMRPFARTLTTLNLAGFKAGLSALVLTCAAGSAQAGGFGSPSGNIRCYLDVFSPQPIGEAALICLIFEADWPVAPDDAYPECALDQTRQIILPPVGYARAEWACHGDVFWPEPLGTISYGSEWFLFNFECEMARNGVRCSNTGDGGFLVNRAGVTLN